MLHEACYGLGDPQAGRFWATQLRVSGLELRLGDQIAASSYKIARGYMEQARWEEARTEIVEGLVADPEDACLLPALCFMEYHLGNMDVGDRARAKILALHRGMQPGPYLMHLHAASTAVIRARNCRGPQDLRLLVVELRPMLTHPLAVPFVKIRVRLVLGLLAAFIGDSNLAREQYGGLVRPDGLNIVRPYYVQRILALAARCMGERDRALVHSQAALELARRWDDRPLEAWIRAEQGETLSEVDSPEAALEAATCLREAHAMAAHLGLKPLGRFTGALLRKLRDSARHLPVREQPGRGRQKSRHAPPVSPGDTGVACVRAAIDRHFAAPLSLATMAGEAGLGVSSLKRQFQHAYGMSVFAYVRNVRLQRAYELLCRRDARVSEVADAVGYRSLSHFALIFKSRFGLSPRSVVALSRSGGACPVFSRGGDGS